MAQKPKLDLAPARLAGRPRDYYVEIWNDADTHYIRVGEFDNFDQATGEFNRLIKGEPDMRVTMRRRAHVFGHYVPRRLWRVMTGVDQRLAAWNCCHR